MISVSGKKWEENITNKNSIEKIKQDYNFSDILSKLVISKKFDQAELSSIDNNLDLNNVFLKNSDFKKSVELVVNSINNKEVICILGDYDVDGSTATSLFVRFFESIKHPYFYYIPDNTLLVVIPVAQNIESPFTISFSSYFLFKSVMPIFLASLISLSLSNMNLP